MAERFYAQFNDATSLHLHSASEMTYIVSSGALNSTHSLTHLIVHMHRRNSYAFRSRAHVLRMRSLLRRLRQPGTQYSADIRLLLTIKIVRKQERNNGEHETGGINKAISALSFPE